MDCLSKQPFTFVVATKRMVLGFALLWGILMSASAQEPEFPEFIPVLTPEAAQVFTNTTGVEVPEVYELFTVALAIANVEDFLPEGMDANELLIDKTTPYYQEVEAQFGSFRDHPLIVQMREAYRPMLEELNVLGLIAPRLQASSYRFTEDGQLTLAETYTPVSEVSLPEFPAVEAVLTSLPFNLDNPEVLALLTDFAEVTGFRQFYTDQRGYYDSLIQLNADLCDHEAARDWLAAQFPAAYDDHTIVLSPLVGGTHNFFPASTPDESVAQALMFVSVYRGDAKTAADVSLQDQVAYCRNSFSEIDHGYVNPITESQYAEQVGEAMSDLSIWSADETNQEVYSTSVDVFEEYMTHGAYSLFLSETLPEEDLEAAISFQENFMVNDRGFVKYKAFNRELLRLYQEREEGQTVTDLYPAVLEWVATQN